MHSSQVAAEAGVNVQTLRYYERRGLLPEPDRLDSGYREWGPETVQIVQFVKRAQRLGFTLREIDVLLELAAGGPESCDAARQLAVEKIDELDSKLAALGAMRDSLERLAGSCVRPRAQRDCPLLHALAADPDTEVAPDDRQANLHRR
jgi:DNA-binding transcriptional MerR regulator